MLRPNAIDSAGPAFQEDAAAPEAGAPEEVAVEQTWDEFDEDSLPPMAKVWLDPRQDAVLRRGALELAPGAFRDGAFRLQGVAAADGLGKRLDGAIDELKRDPSRAGFLARAAPLL